MRAPKGFGGAQIHHKPRMLVRAYDENGIVHEVWMTLGSAEMLAKDIINELAAFQEGQYETP